MAESSIAPLTAVTHVLESTLLRDVDACPLCASTAWNESANPLANLYSEKLGKLLGCREAELLTALGNRECLRCGLIYKGSWLPPPVLAHLFSEGVPQHPKGWDVASVEFSARGFQAEVASYVQALNRADAPAIARQRRRLDSIVDSLIEIADSEFATELRDATARGDVAWLASQQERLAALSWRPWPFKRFSGFSDLGLWQWLELQLGPIASYGEVGCPLSGFLLRRPAAGVAWYYFDRAETNFWGASCKSQGLGCVEHLIAEFHRGQPQPPFGGDVPAPPLVETIEPRAWSNTSASPIDLLGVFQYLDHVERPLEFLEEALSQARAVVLILDCADQPTAVQHFTGWNSRSMSVAAGKLGARLRSGFEPIRSAGSEVYLLVRDNARV